MIRFENAVSWASSGASLGIHRTGPNPSQNGTIRQVLGVHLRPAREICSGFRLLAAL